MNDRMGSMRKTTEVKKAIAMVGAVAALTGAGFAGMAGSASAAEGHTVRLCSDGDYQAFAEFPQDGHRTATLSPGQCDQFEVRDNVTYMKVYGYDSAHKKFYVATPDIDAASGWTGSAKGTAQHPIVENVS